MIETNSFYTSDYSFNITVLPGRFIEIIICFIPKFKIPSLNKLPFFLSCSLIKYLGASPSNNIFLICWRVHSSVGFFVTLKWMSFLRRCSITTRTWINFEVDTRNTQEVYWFNFFWMILQKCFPVLAIVSFPFRRHISLNCRFRNVESKFQ